MQRTLILLLAGLVVASAQPFQPGQNLAPLGGASLFRVPLLTQLLPSPSKATLVIQNRFCLVLSLHTPIASRFTGNLRTQDFGGPYNLSLLTVQEAEVKSEFVKTVVLGVQHIYLLADHL